MIKADLADYTEVSGCIVFKPDSYEIWEKIKEFGLNIWKKIKDVLGIESPSKLFAATVGFNIPAGIWEGIRSQMPTLQSQISDAMSSLTANVNPNLQFAQAGYAGGQQPSQMVNVTVQATVGNEIDVYKLSRRVAEEIKRNK